MTRARDIANQGAGTFGSITADDLTVDTTTLVVDETNNRVGIGTASPDAKLDLAGASGITPFTSGDRLGLSIRGATGTTDYQGIDFIENGQNKPVARIASVNTSSGSYLQFGTSNLYVSGVTNTAMSIDYNGRMLINTTDALGSAYLNIIHSTAGENALIIKTSSTTYAAGSIIFQNSSGGNAGYIQITGASSVSYVTSSDYRLKENVVDMTSAIDRIKALKPSQFNFIGEERTVDGFLAHEVQDVVPEAITGEKDAVDDDGNPVYQGIDQSKLVPLLTGALQEAIARIETLEAEVATLKGASA